MTGSISMIENSGVENLIRNLRKRRKISQDEMAKKIGITRDTYRNWEKGKGLDFNKLKMIAEIMNVKFALVVFE